MAVAWQWHQLDRMQKKGDGNFNRVAVDLE